MEQENNNNQMEEITQPKNFSNETVRKVEEYLIDPQKAVFEAIVEFKQSLQDLQDALSDLDMSKIKYIQGEDGKTPIRGVDYMTPEDIDTFEAFINDKIDESLNKNKVE